MRFKGLDLNLLGALAVLLEERSVSRTAARLHLSQPAISAALARLRAYFGDPLLVTQGKRMVPTAHALALQPQLGAVLAQIDELIAGAAQFDPATSTRTFRICLSDYLITILAVDLVPRLRSEAPGILLDLAAPSEDSRIALDRGTIDLLLTPEEHCVPRHPTELLFEEQHVVAGWRGNPLMEGAMGEDAFFEAGHIAVKLGGVNPASFAETRFDAVARKRRVEITVASFTMVPPLLVGTDRLAVMHERLARSMARNFPIEWQVLPFAFPAMREMIQYNRTRTQDEGLRWLVEELKRAAGGAGAQTLS
ncbi:MAG: bacterial regulatory helix-turn-helix, lysR family protein [Proteobacteria bacterium]|nr:bacterial regulatory helix-turn-helix, lysR family protein [Pseudomonadota bacterium]